MLRYWLHKQRWYRRWQGGVWVWYFSLICYEAVWFKLDQRESENPRGFRAGPGGIVEIENWTLPVARVVV